MANLPNLSQRDMLDIIFENRNRAYGAYQLRREYPNTLGRAVFMAMLLIGVFLIIPRVLRALSSTIPSENTLAVEYKTSTPPIIEVPPVPPPVVNTPPPPAKSTIRFVPPAPTPDEKVPDETQQPDITALANSSDDIGDHTQQGDPDAAPSISPAAVDGPIIETPRFQEPEGPYEASDVQKMPSFPGGETELLKYLSRNIRYPDIARETNTQGVVALQFIIDTEGNIRNVVVVKDIGSGCGKEAIRVVNSMPRWIPGEANGHPVKVRFTLPIRFRLQ